MDTRFGGIGLLAVFAIALVSIALAIGIGAAAAQDNGGGPTGALPLPGWVKAEMWTPYQVVVSWEPVAGAEYYDVTLYFGEDTPELAFAGRAVYGSSDRVGGATVNTHWRYGLGPWESPNLAGACVYAASGAHPDPAPAGCVWADANRRPPEPEPTPFIPTAPERIIAIVLHDPALLVVTWRPAPGVDQYGVKAFFRGQPVFSSSTTGAVFALSNADRPEADFQSLTRVCVFSYSYSTTSECRPAEIIWEVKPRPTPQPGSPTPAALCPAVAPDGNAAASALRTGGILVTDRADVVSSGGDEQTGTKRRGNRRAYYDDGQGNDGQGDDGPQHRRSC